MSSDQIRDAIEPDICDEHGGWLRRNCPVCRRRQETTWIPTDCPDTPTGEHWLEDGQLPGLPYRCFRCGQHFTDDDTEN
jgi:hypothetical protein